MDHERARPWFAFVEAAREVVQDLVVRHHHDLWVVALREAQDGRAVVAAAGPWLGAAGPLGLLPWSATYCAVVAERTGPVVVPDVQASPDYRPLAVGPLAHVRSYVGVPLVDDDGTVVGSLCGLGRQVGEGDRDDGALLASVGLAGRVLSTVLAGEARVSARSEEAARAWGLVEADALTGLLNRRGWDRALRRVGHEGRQVGRGPGCVVVDLDDLKGVNDSRGHAAGDALLRRCAEVLATRSRPGDAVARIGGDEFGLLVHGEGDAAAPAVAGRLRRSLAEAGVPAAVGHTAWRPGDTAATLVGRADVDMYRRKTTRRTRRPTSAGSPG